MALGRSKNAVNTEIRRNGGKRDYQAKGAHNEAVRRKQVKAANARFAPSPLQLREFKEGIKKNESPYMIRKKMKLSYQALLALYKSCQMPIPTVFELVHEALDKIYALEEQVKILFEEKL